MYPELFRFPEWLPFLGGRVLHTYGLLVALGFLAGMLWVKYESRRLGLPVQRMLDLVLYIVIAAIVGSRVFYVVVSVPQWWEHPLVFFKIWQGGLVFYGGLLAAVGFAIWFCRRHSLSFLQVADVFSPGIALGHAIGRLGCFAAGCCYGKPLAATSFWALQFPKVHNQIAPFDHPVYPTQLFEAATELAIFFMLLARARGKTFRGQIFLLYLILYSVTRSGLETLRGDKIRGFIIEGTLSTSQLISVVLVGLAIAAWIYLKRQKQKSGG